MKAPAGDPGDFYVALGAESTLLIPEIAKSAGTSKRFQHVSPVLTYRVIPTEQGKSTSLPARGKFIARWTDSGADNR
jgi:hypothetical protein